MSAYSKKIFVITLILAATCFVMPLQTNAQHYAIVKGSDVNVRSGPDKSYGVQGVAKKGDTVTITNESKGWSEVTTSKNINGYIATSFLEKFGSDTSPIPPIKERKSYWWLILLVIIVFFLAGRWLQGRKIAGKKTATPQPKPVVANTAPPVQQQAKPVAPQPVQQSEPVIKKNVETPVPIPPPMKPEVPKEEEPQPSLPPVQEKELPAAGSGDDFEDFVAAKIAGNPFLSLKHRRSDKIALEQRISAESGKYPDFDVVFKLQYDNETTEQAFAVECKWRRNFLNGSLQIDSWQIDNYRSYAEKGQMNVYLIIGYGGEASKPDKLYLIPLTEITDGNLSADFLQRFEHKADETFYYTPEKRELKLLTAH